MLSCVTVKKFVSNYENNQQDAFFFLWRCDPTRVMTSSFTRFLDHTQRRSTVGGAPLNE